MFFDTADMYSGGVSEQITGRLLRKLFPRRDDYVLATKVYYPTGPGPNDRGLSRKHILAGIDASLARLGTDHVDLYQVHRFDDQTPATGPPTSTSRRRYWRSRRGVACRPRRSPSRGCSAAAG
jgi:aryl-alcohol dehydrogenase-like predicted oxidoreductase